MTNKPAPRCGSCRRSEISEPAAHYVEGYRNGWNPSFTKQTRRFVRLNLCDDHLTAEMDDGLTITKRRAYPAA